MKVEKDAERKTGHSITEGHDYSTGSQDNSSSSSDNGETAITTVRQRVTIILCDFCFIGERLQRQRRKKTGEGRAGRRQRTKERKAAQAAVGRYNISVGMTQPVNVFQLTWLFYWGRGPTPLQCRVGRRYDYPNNTSSIIEL